MISKISKIRILLLVTFLCLAIAFPSPSMAITKVDVAGLNKGIISSTTTATTTAGKCPATPLRGRRSIIVHNTSAQTVYVGHSAVSSTNGYELEEDDAISIDVTDNVDIYVRTAASTADVRTLEIR